MRRLLVARGNVRDRALVLTLVSSAGTQMAAVAATFLSLPFVTRSLSTDEFGVLVSITGLATILGFADLGVGAALSIRLAQSLASLRGDGRVVIGSAMSIMFAAAALILTVGFALVHSLSWHSILGAGSVAGRDVRSAVLAAVVCVAWSIPASAGNRILFGLQRGYLAGRVLIASVLGGALASISMAVLGAPLWGFVLASVGTPAMVGTLASLGVLFLMKDTSGVVLIPRRPNRTEILQLIGSSRWFFIISITSLLGYQADVLIVANVLDASQAGVFAIAAKLFGMVVAVLYPAIVQLGPAFADALSRHDHGWIRRRVWGVSAAAFALAAVPCLVLVLWGDLMIRVWLTEELSPPRSLLLAAAAWTVYSLASAPMYSLLHAEGLVRAHALMCVAVSVANILLSVHLARQWGLSGPMWASLFATAVFAGVPGVLLTRQVLTRLSTVDETPSADPAPQGPQAAKEAT